MKGKIEGNVAHYMPNPIYVYGSMTYAHKANAQKTNNKRDICSQLFCINYL